MPLPARDLKITYGSTVLGGTSSAYFLDAPMRFSISPDKAVVEADVIVIGTGEGNFASNCTALETAFRTPRGFLEVKFGSSVHETFDSTDGVNTGFNQVATISKVGSDDDTGRSRRYHIVVAVDLPADLYANSDGSTTNARRAATINLYTTDSGRRRFTVTGTYTASASSGNGARAQYNANITDYINSLTTAFTGTWEVLLDPQVATDDQDKICNFAVTMEELIFNQSDGVLDDPTLRRQKITITRSSDLSGDAVLFGVRAQKIQRVVIDYSVSVNKALTQDLKSLWASTIKPYLTKLAQQVSSSNSSFIESEIPSFDFVENRISARMTYVTPPSGTLLSARISTTDSENTGVALIPVWADDRLKKYKFDGPAVVTRTVTIQTTEVANPGDASVVNQSGGAFDTAFGINLPPDSGNDSDVVSVDDEDANSSDLATAGGVKDPAKSPDGGSLKRLFLGVTHDQSPRRIGPVDGLSLDVIDRMTVARYEYYVDAADGGGD